MAKRENCKSQSVWVVRGKSHKHPVIPDTSWKQVHTFLLQPLSRQWIPKASASCLSSTISLPQSRDPQTTQATQIQKNVAWKVLQRSSSNMDYCSVNEITCYSVSTFTYKKKTPYQFMQQTLLDMQLRQPGLLTDTVIWHSRTNLSTTLCIQLKSMFPNIRLHYIVKISDRQNSVQIQDTAMHFHPA